MEIKELFPTLVMVDSNIELAEKLLPVCNYFTEKTTTNCLGIANFPSTLSNEDLGPEVNNHPVVREAFDYIINNCLIPFEKQRGLEAKGMLRPYGFFSSMEQNSHCINHIHLECRYSGIIYLEAGPAAPPLVFHDPRPHIDFIRYNIETPGPYNNQVYFEQPVAGKILLWDSWLHHSIPMKLTTDPRKTFVFNL